MIEITLQQIKDQAPCTDGWAKVLKSKGGTKADMSLPFPLADILVSNGLNDTLWCLRALPEHDALWRKFSVWCAKQVEHLMTDARSREALVVAWKHSEGLATDEELREAEEAAGEAAKTATGGAWTAAWTAAGAVAWTAARAAEEATGAAAWTAAVAAEEAAGEAWTAAWTAAVAGAVAREAAQSKQKEKLIEILTAGEWA